MNTHEGNHLNESLDTLCALLSEELRRQEEVLDNCRAQTAAARAYDMELLEAKTREMISLIEKAIVSEQARHDALRDVVAWYGIPAENQTLTTLAQVVPSPWRQQLSDFQDRMQDVLQTTRRTVRKNALLFKGTLRSLSRSLDLLIEPNGHDARTYTADGNEPTVPYGVPATLIDARG